MSDKSARDTYVVSSPLTPEQLEWLEQRRRLVGEAFDRFAADEGEGRMSLTFRGEEYLSSLLLSMVLQRCRYHRRLPAQSRYQSECGCNDSVGCIHRDC
jgi:hypothetical protein